MKLYKLTIIKHTNAFWKIIIIISNLLHRKVATKCKHKTLKVDVTCNYSVAALSGNIFTQNGIMHQAITTKTPSVASTELHCSI